jgi:hypothetical protein
LAKLLSAIPRLFSGAAGAVGSRLKLILIALAALATIAAVVALGWILYNYGGLRRAEQGIETQGAQNEALQSSLIADRKQEERDHARIAKAHKAAAAAAGNLAAPGADWLTAWLNCVHAPAGAELHACSPQSHPGAATAVQAARATRQQSAADGRARQNGNGPKARAPAPGGDRRPAAGVQVKP